MLRTPWRTLCGWIVGLAAFSAGHLSAQEAVLNEFYGAGVHHYFAGNLDRAVSDLSAAINGGSKDPRAFYYRALAKMKLGQQDSATLDLSMGATLETADVNQFYPVGKALERIQGSTRAQIERYRAVARAEAYERQQRRDQARYEERRRAEADVLRNPKFAPSPAPAAPAAGAPAAGAPAAGVPKPPKPGEVAEPDPFAEDADNKPEPKPPVNADEDEAMPADDAALAEEIPADDTDAKADDNPFGDEKETK